MPNFKIDFYKGKIEQKVCNSLNKLKFLDKKQSKTESQNIVFKKSYKKMNELMPIKSTHTLK